MMVWSSMWPMWSEPVTLGGGMTMEKTGGGADGWARYRLLSSQN